MIQWPRHTAPSTAMRDAAGDLVSLFGVRRSRREHTASSLLPSAPQVVSYRIYISGAEANGGGGKGDLTYSSFKS